jgi:hypothetical protein
MRISVERQEEHATKHLTALFLALLSRTAGFEEAALGHGKSS